MKRTEPKSVMQVIEDALAQTDLTGAFREQEASYLWPEVVGPGVNRYTSRRYVDRGVLHVYITSGPLKSELEYMRPNLTERINQLVGSAVLTDIKIH